ncbi:hypothetical protein [Mariniblastus fucicola]|uniref:Uncharacterized protein n=1 Tax=Mariniblastus fucicola TaxID=980251 RepID=A0A5B9P4B9_9BACT|nr:hypothetical protein [Mariniblastus fucicola]QEG21248.1 hypothetical protein MFFC18_11030 [Mariniblastus fucicola]
MRLVLTVVLCLLIIGGTWTYISIDSGIKKAASEVLYTQASGKTIVSIDRTFECFGNADFEEPAIKVTFGGEDVFLDQSESIPPEQSVQFELENVEQLDNTLTVFANAVSPDSFGDDAPPLRAMLVQISYDDQVVAEKMFHADSLAVSLGGDVSFSIPASDSHEGHGH